MRDHVSFLVVYVAVVAAAAALVVVVAVAVDAVAAAAAAVVVVVAVAVVVVAVVVVVVAVAAPAADPLHVERLLYCQHLDKCVTRYHESQYLLNVLVWSPVEMLSYSSLLSLSMITPCFIHYYIPNVRVYSRRHNSVGASAIRVSTAHCLSLVLEHERWRRS